MLIHSCFSVKFGTDCTEPKCQYIYTNTYTYTKKKGQMWFKIERLAGRNGDVRKFGERFCLCFQCTRLE